MKFETVKIRGGGLLSDALFAAGVPLSMPCGGRRSCGKCAVFVSGAADEVSEEEKILLARLPEKTPPAPGYVRRLACFCHISGEVLAALEDDGRIAVASPCRCGAPSPLPRSPAGDIPPRPRLPIFNLISSKFNYDGEHPEDFGVAVDIGTTTVTVIVLRLGDGRILADKSERNRQTVFGADVLSRIDAANRLGAEPLRDAITGQLCRLIADALSVAGAAPEAVRRICVTGNTTMLHLLTGHSVASLGVVPFEPETRFGETLPAVSLFPALTSARLYLPNAISAYVGPDIVCGILSSGLPDRENSLLVDVGTNGEMAINANGCLLCCATAAGPAFEGAEISSGMAALPGAIDFVRPIPGALRSPESAARGTPRIKGDYKEIYFSTIGGQPAVGVCGTGLISAVDTLLKLGLMDETGMAYDDELPLGNSGISLTQQDIRKLQLAKSAIASGIATLIHEGGLPENDVRALYLSGGFGSYIRPESAIGIGLIPKTLGDRSVSAGNSALAGAAQLTLNAGLREKAVEIANVTKEIQLATHPFFMEQYIENMMFDSIHNTL
ncbi:MAG: ASKHA domain-containing protein [Oscillospiraceae bacterium]|jgi:uncharacterized 2Fe-2S/4Fe-4S cluster protein (DUF4445 family)|nr:ASKHA domain-containing protein [Oscillospiraceae bacterium]